MRIAVCDDESSIRAEIIRLIRVQQPNADVSAFSSPEEMLSDVLNYSIVILDISMGTSISGIELAKIVRFRQEQNQFQKAIIIFITGYSEHMQAAFDVNAYHYLIKPIDKLKFAQVFGRAWKDALQREEASERCLLLKTAGMQRKVHIKDIYYIESNNKQVIIHTQDELMEASIKMESLANELGSAFYRSHRCYLVNMEKIAAYSSDTIQLINGDTLFLAKKKYQDFVKAFMRYAKEGGIVNV